MAIARRTNREICKRCNRVDTKKTEARAKQMALTRSTIERFVRVRSRGARTHGEPRLVTLRADVRASGKCVERALERILLVLFAITLCCGVASADSNPTIRGSVAATPSEAAFVAAMQVDLRKRFATVADAEKAGYFRYTNADDTGAISYANLQWQSSDVHHPSQLWYDTAGNLLGADYSVLKTDSHRPKIWGIQPGRWAEFDDHVHYVTKNAKTGGLRYDLYVFPKKFIGAGGDMKHPKAATLVKLRLVNSSAEVAKIFDFPTIWDLIVWVKPNPNGPFADKNPLVKP